MSTTTATWTPITDVDEARRIAREWQSPGSIGHVLASFASGCKVDRWRLYDDAQRTQHEQPGMPLADWADLDRLRDWCKAEKDGVLGGPHGEMRVITNNKPRDVLGWWELTPSERDEFDYVTDPDNSREFVRYRGDVIDITDRDGVTEPGGELERKGWDSYQSDSFFSGLVFRYVPDTDYEQVVVGRYVV